MASAMEHYQKSEQALASARLTSGIAIERNVARAAVHAQLAIAAALLEAKGATGDETAPTA